MQVRSIKMLMIVNIDMKRRFQPNRKEDKRKEYVRHVIGRDMREEDGNK